MEDAHIKCPICGVIHEHNSNTLEYEKNPTNAETFIGFGLCEKHDIEHTKGYIAFVEIDPSKSHFHDNILTSTGAHHTGRYAHMKRSDAAKIMQVTEDSLTRPTIYCNQSVMNTIIANTK